MASETKPSVAIIGGTGEFGRLFAKIFTEDGHRVVITGRDGAKGERAADATGATYQRDIKKAAKEATIVIICVPIDKTVDVIKEVGPSVKSGSLLMDFTSVKVEPTKAMEQHAGADVDVIGTHPMFGPRVPGLEGQTVILTPVRGKKWLSFLNGFFTEKKARVFEATPEEHDRVMAVVQGLTHFTYITSSSTIKKLGLNAEDTRRFASPVYELMLDFIARIVGQNPQLYASIQMHNPFVEEVHDTFIKAAEELKRIVKEKDMAGFVKVMTSSAKIFKDVDGSMGKSDKAISALTMELGKLKESINKSVVLRHIYSGAVHYGIVRDITPDKVKIESKGKSKILKVSNIELLDETSALEWKKENLAQKKTDVSVIFTEATDEKQLAKALTLSAEPILSCEAVDVFKGSQIPPGFKSITFRLSTLENFGSSKVEKIIKAFGGKIR